MPIAKLNYKTRKDPLWMIIFSIVLGSVLMVYPMAYETSGWRPSVMLMIMLFWILYQPGWSGGCELISKLYFYRLIPTCINNLLFIIWF